MTYNNGRRGGRNGERKEWRGDGWRREGRTERRKREDGGRMEGEREGQRVEEGKRDERGREEG